MFILLTKILFAVEHLSGTPLWGRLLALPTNIKLGLKVLPGTNTVAYNRFSQFMVLKSFITLARIDNIGSLMKMVGKNVVTAEYIDPGKIVGAELI